MDIGLCVPKGELFYTFRQLFKRHLLHLDGVPGRASRSSWVLDLMDLHVVLAGQQGDVLSVAPTGVLPVEPTDCHLLQLLGDRLHGSHKQVTD